MQHENLSKIKRISLARINELWASPEVRYGFNHVAFAHAIINEIRKQGFVVEVEEEPKEETKEGVKDET